MLHVSPKRLGQEAFPSGVRKNMVGRVRSLIVAIAFQSYRRTAPHMPCPRTTFNSDAGDIAWATTTRRGPSSSRAKRGKEGHARETSALAYDGPLREELWNTNDGGHCR